MLENPCWLTWILTYIFLAGDENFALFRPASQSSTVEGMVASRAVDGNSVDDSSVTATHNEDYSPWWKVQLDFPIWVTSVEITNRKPVGMCERICHQSGALALAVPSQAMGQIRKIAGCTCAENTGNVFPAHQLQRKLLVSDPGMHHGMCVTAPAWRTSLTYGHEETFPAFPAYAQLVILRIW